MMMTALHHSRPTNPERPLRSGTCRRLLLACLLQAVLCLVAKAQPYAIDWFTIDGGGGTSTGGVYSVSGTIGQPDAGPAMTGGNYTLTGGFWSLISVIQTPGAPTLYIRQFNGVVTVSWEQPAAGWVLEATPTLSGQPASWQVVPAEQYQSNVTELFVTIPASENQRFYRLRRP